MAGSVFRLPEMVAYIKLSRSAIYDRMNESSPRYDSTFPKKFSLGGAVGWFKDEVDAWLENCAEKAHAGTSHGEQLMSEMPVLVNSHSKSKSSASVTQSRPELRQPNEDFARIPAPHFSQSNQTSVTRQPNLGELITNGTKINSIITKYLSMTTWTPAMGAMLVCGIQAPLSCNEIPNKGMGLDDKTINSSNARFRKARSILEDWNDQNARPPTISPLDFLIWSQEEQINTDWLRLFLDLAGCTTSETVDLTPARFALLVAR
jgi:predicted DNA-binding transcriptional regulator AlpA